MVCEPCTSRNDINNLALDVPTPKMFVNLRLDDGNEAEDPVLDVDEDDKDDDVDDDV